MGSSSFSIPALNFLLKNNYNILSVYSQPPSRSKRGHKINISPLHEFAEQNNLSVRNPKDLNSSIEYNFLKDQSVDLAIVVAYGQIIPKNLLCTTRLGFINIHASLLPRWRGAAPIQRAIMSKDKKIGVTIMKIEEKLDSGPVISFRELQLNSDKTCGEIEKELSAKQSNDIDVVIPIPDTSRTSALPISILLNKKLREGFVKNRYIGRTFIMPGQKIRKKSVKQKLNTINREFKNKNILLIDDSIVRGNTSKQIIQMARDAGAKKVYFASASPPIRFPNVYGIDMPYVDELIAYNKNIDEICKEIGSDKLIYQDLDDLIAAVKEGRTSIKNFDTSCFSGEYITEVSKDYLINLGLSR